MERYISEYPEYKQTVIRNLLRNIGHEDLVASSLTGTPVAKTLSGEKYLLISSPAGTEIVELRISSPFFGKTDGVPVMDDQDMKKLV